MEPVSPTMKQAFLAMMVLMLISGIVYCIIIGAVYSLKRNIFMNFFRATLRTFILKYKRDRCYASRSVPMSSKHTHYDNLKVSRDAPLEVIQSAYKTLSKKYHPDHNSNDPNATRIMTILNASYAVLTDPVKRQQYDEQILRYEAETQNAVPPRPQQKPMYTSSSWRSTHTYEFDLVAHFRRYCFAYGFVAFVAIVMVSQFKEINRTPGPPVMTPTATEPITSGQPDPASQRSPAPPVRPVYVRSAAAPNGQPWPVDSGYILGYKRLNTKGLSDVTVDNTLNDSDAFIKLVYHDSSTPIAVRFFFIRAHEQFRLAKVSPGLYDIRYKDLDSGVISKSTPFELKETQVTDGTQYSKIRLTLYKVRDGNMAVETISEEEF